ncbi:exported hypothetical protein [Gammaproteobacteria bacterium]
MVYPQKLLVVFCAGLLAACPAWGWAGGAVIAIGGNDLADHVSFAVKHDGTVWAWGSDHWYGLGLSGDEIVDFREVPGAVSNLADTVNVAAGGQHVVALKKDGTIWGWGVGSARQIDPNLQGYYPEPIQLIDGLGIMDLTGIQAIAAGDAYTIALNNQGVVLGWGAHPFGIPTTLQVGFGPLTQDCFTGKIPGAVGIAAGYRSTYIVLQDGTLMGWGWNSQGQLGDGTTMDRTCLLPVRQLTEIKAAAAGGEHALALKQDGTVWAWGSNTHGQLGNGSQTNAFLPVQVTGLTGIKAIAAGQDHSLALKTDGTLWAWGLNLHGQLGDGTTLDRTAPVQVATLQGVTTMAAGFEHSLAVASDGSVWGWGLNDRGSLGNGAAFSVQLTPAPVMTDIPGAALLIRALPAAKPLFQAFRLSDAPQTNPDLCHALPPVAATGLGDTVSVLLSLDGFLESAECGQPADPHAIYSIWVAARKPNGSWMFRKGTSSWVTYDHVSLNAPLPAFRSGISREKMAQVKVSLMTSNELGSKEWAKNVIYVGYGTSQADMMQAKRYRPMLDLNLVEIKQ